MAEDEDKSGLARHWQVVENVVAAVQRWAAVPGATVTQRASVPVRADPTEQRDVDVLVSIPIGDKAITIGIEVKDHGRPIDVGELGQIVDLSREVRLDHFCVVSTSGYTEGAEKKARRDGIELMTIEEFERSDFFLSPRGSLSFEVGGEPMGMRLLYADELLREVGALLENVGQTAELSDFVMEGAPLSLLDLITSEGNRVATAQQQQLVDQQPFEVVIALPPGYCTKIVARGIALPTPEQIHATYRFFRRPLPEYRFRVKDVEMLSVLRKVGTELLQTTIPGIPHPDGGRRLSFQSGPAKPKKVKRARPLGPVPRNGVAKKIESVGELLHWSYANLASVDAAETRGLAKRDMVCWMIRAKLFKGLRDGTMNVGTLFADVLKTPSDVCIYCGAPPPPKLHGDHLIPRHRGGPESGDNLVRACRACNSSKNARDLLEWYASKDEFPPVVLMRRYLKLAMMEAHLRGIMNVRLADAPPVTFSIDYVPTSYPEPGEVRGIKKREQ